MSTLFRWSLLIMVVDVRSSSDIYSAQRIGRSGAHIPFWLLPVFYRIAPGIRKS